MIAFDNRELSWLKFNERVLEEAMDKTNPLLERLQFFSIFQTNLDEFFMVRVGSLFEKMAANYKRVENKTYKNAAQQLELIFPKVRDLEMLRDTAFSEILRECAQNGIEYVTSANETEDDRKFLREHFKKEIKPFLVPMVLEKGNPFPFLNNKMLHVCLSLEDDMRKGFVGMIPLDENIKRFIVLPEKVSCAEKDSETPQKLRFALAEDLLMCYADSIYKNYKITGRTLFRLTRNADLDADEASYDHDIDYREHMTQLMRKRKKQTPVRIQLTDVFSLDALEFLSKKLPLKGSDTENINVKQIFYSHSPLDFSFISNIRDIIKNPSLKFPKYQPQQSPLVNNFHTMFTQIRNGDILLCYPYESIKPFIRLLDEAAEDKNVTGIKITLYRLARNSKVINALAAAAENGKDVTALVELRARFDEENNIGWSRKLENAGVKVVYGPKRLKVHSKLLLITREIPKSEKQSGSDRRPEEAVKREFFTQIGTGNYNEKTSGLYTDYSILTHNQEIGEDAEKVFNLLINQKEFLHFAADYDKYSETPQLAIDKKKIVKTCPITEKDLTFKHLLMSPITLQGGVLSLIDDEIAKAKSGEAAYVGAKLNSLTDKVIIKKLIEASNAGVKIDLLVRGICCLVADVPNATENVTVKSIVGRFLEHSRVYVFGNISGGTVKVYISSADYMTRNTICRIEVAAPILDDKIKSRILRMFVHMFNDNVKCRVQQSDGTYIKDKPYAKNFKQGAVLINSQEDFIAEAISAAEQRKFRRK